jgi:hypothetical protein
MQKHGVAVTREEETVFTALNFADAADLFRHCFRHIGGDADDTRLIRLARRGVMFLKTLLREVRTSMRGFKLPHELFAPLERAWGSAS